jgi:glycosyltransferase involved in cell wall biosynthesis
MLKVLFDDQIFTGQRVGGISRYFSQLFKNFENSNLVDYKLPLIYSENVYLKELNKIKKYSFLEGKEFKGSYRLLTFLQKLNRISSRYALSKGHFDVFHPTDYDTYFIELLGNKPYVITIYDMIHEVYAGEFFKKDDLSIERKRTLAQRASKIITISETSKRDIIKFYGMDEDKITVVHLANSLDVNLCEQIKVPEQYLLFVGARGRYKNFNFFIKSIASLLKKYKQLYVICVGGSYFSTEEEIFLADLGIKDQILHYVVSDAQLVYLYKNAIAFVFPTLYEGFGLPMVEAAACGCPVVASDCDVLKEIGQDSALYFDGRSNDAIVHAVSQIIEDKNLRLEFISKGLVRAKDFSWVKAAKKTFDVYKSI